MLSVANKSVMLSVVKLGAIMPSVMAPKRSSLFPGLEEEENHFLYFFQQR